MTITAIPRPAVAGLLEISGVGAGLFRAENWRKGKFHLVPDVRRPLISPREGKFRNIYAPSVVKTARGWRIFFGGWDGSASGNDCIYSVDTVDWMSFGEHEKVIDHGAFQHVCNVSAIVEKDQTFSLMCTLFKDPLGLNKPAFFSSKEKVATQDNFIRIADYPHFTKADINGMNVLLRDGDRYLLYFADFNNFNGVYRASSIDGKSFTLDGNCVLKEQLAVNDVKKFDKSYLMGLHRNMGKLFYTVSDHPMRFPETQELFHHMDDDERYIVSVGFVSDGERMLGVLYGAGAKASLDANRIFARWLQKRVVLVADGKRIEAYESRGPDRQIFELAAETKCSIEIYDDDGETLLRKIENVTLKPGGEFSIHDALPTSRKHGHED